MTASLPAFSLLNTRPAHQSAGLQALVKAAGAEALACPTLRVVLQALPPAQLAQLALFDVVILTSVNAVNGLASALQQAGLAWPPAPPEALQWRFAIGQATVKAAPEWHLQSADAQRFDSEALLAHPALQALQGKRVLLVKGQNGRELIAQTLQARGAAITVWEVYRRQACELCETAWQQFVQSRRPLVLGSSVEGLQALLDAVKNHPKTQQAGVTWMLQQPLVAYSERIAQWARGQGWQGRIGVVATHSDAGTLACIQQHWPHWFAGRSNEELGEESRNEELGEESRNEELGEESRNEELGDEPSNEGKQQ